MKKHLTAALLALAATGASAQIYLEGAFGLAHANTDCESFSDCDESSNGYKLMAGYRFSPNLSVEAGYVDFGEVEFDYFGNNITHETHGVFIAGAFRGELMQNLHGVARLGIANITSDTNGFGLSDDETAGNVYFGLGLEYSFTKNIKAVAGIDFSQSAENAVFSSGAVRLISLGAQIEF